jgi:hypothetical protein
MKTNKPLLGFGASATAEKVTHYFTSIATKKKRQGIIIAHYLY